MKRILHLLLISAIILNIAFAQKKSPIDGVRPPQRTAVPVTIKEKKAETQRQLEKANEKLEIANNKIIALKNEKANSATDKIKQEKKLLESRKEVEKLDTQTLKLRKELNDLTIYSSNREEISQHKIEELMEVAKIQSRTISDYKSIIKEKNDIIKIQYDSLLYLKEVTEDCIDTKNKSVRIKNQSYTFETIRFISGFSPNSSDMPKMTKEEAEFWRRLSDQLKKYKLKIRLVGTCSYTEMNKESAKKLGERRAFSTREYFIKNLGFDEATISDWKGTTNCTNCNTVSIQIVNK